MYEVHIKGGCTVNFYQVIEVPAKVLKEPAFYRHKVKPREHRSIFSIPVAPECEDFLTGLTRAMSGEGEAMGGDAA